MTKDNLSSPLAGEQKIELQENNIDDLRGIARDDASTSWVSPEANESVAKNIAKLVRARFK